MSYSASFDLGNVTMKTNPTGGPHVPGNSSILIQYEAVVPKERMRITDGEHIHSYGVVFECGGAEEKNVFVCESKAKFVDRKPMTVSKFIGLITALNHSVISPLCLMRVSAPHGSHIRQAKFCLWVCHVFFSKFSSFCPSC